MRDFMQLLSQQFEVERRLCVDLRPGVEGFPLSFGSGMEVSDRIFQTNKQIVDLTARFVCLYRINRAYYASLGQAGFQALKQTIFYIHENYPWVPVVLDAKYSDSENANRHYALEAFGVENYNADAVTVSPFTGRQSVMPFLEWTAKGVFVLCRTSDPGATEFQDTLLRNGIPNYLYVADQVTKHWNTYGNCLLVVEDKDLGQLRLVRSVADIPLFVSGVRIRGENLSNVVAIASAKKRPFLLGFRSSVVFRDEESFSTQVAEEAYRIHGLMPSA